MRHLLLALATMLLTLGGAAQAATPPTDQGPMWWKISNGAGAVLWVLGIPDGMLMDADWNDASLQKRMSSADRLISPLLGPPLKDPGFETMPNSGSSQVVEGPCFRGDYRDAPFEAQHSLSFAVSTAPGGALSQHAPINWLWWRTLGRNQYGEVLCIPPPPAPPLPLPISSVTFKDPLSGRLTPEMMKRFEQDMPFMLGEARTALLNGKTWEAALWMDLWNWPRDKLLGNPVTARAQLLAKQAGTPVNPVYVAALWKPILTDNKLPPPGLREQFPDYNRLYNLRPNIRIDPPELLQQTCLEQVLTETESGQMPALRTAAMQAWARGDLENALKRSNTVQLCLMGDEPTTNAAAFEASQAGLYIQAMDGIFDKPGQRVALIEFDPLLLKKTGVLDYYRRLGYDITTSNGMGD